MNDRIKLAKAMNLDFVVHGDMVYLRQSNSKPMVQWNPEKWADDDYAVLEWMREKGLQDANTWTKFVDTLNDFPEMGLKVAYQIGDYARAALRAIDD